MCQGGSGNPSWITDSIWTMPSCQKNEFSHAIAVMDKIGGWEEENWVMSRFATSMWIFTKAVIYNGQNNMPNYRLQKIRSIMEAVNWACDDALDDHV